MLQKKAISNDTLDLLKEIMKNEKFNDFYLVGGTALALQYGHRKSEDLDFFSTKRFNIEEFIQAIQSDFSHFRLFQETTIGFRSVINDVKVDFLSYPYPLLEEKKIENIRMYSPKDIAAMKVKSIGNRGAKKDFFDLNELLNHFGLEEIIELFKSKYKQTDIGHYIISLTYFADAEKDNDPLVLNSITWKEVKRNIKNSVNNYLKRLLKS